jgi:hypothetical protein
MDPRNPLARIVRLSRSPVVARFAFVLEPFGARDELLARRVDVEIKDGRKRVFLAPPHMSLMELLDQVRAFLDHEEKKATRGMKSARAQRREISA